MKRAERQKLYDDAYQLGQQHFRLAGRMFPNPFEPGLGTKDKGNDASYIGFLDGAWDARLEMRVRAAIERGRADALNETSGAAPWPAGTIEATEYARAWIGALLHQQVGCPIAH